MIYILKVLQEYKGVALTFFTCMINVGYGQRPRRFAEVNVHLQSVKIWAAAGCYIALYVHYERTGSKYFIITGMDSKG